MKRGRKAISAAEKRARDAFREAVLKKGGCAMNRPGEQCESGPCDPHHVIREQVLRRRALYVLRLAGPVLYRLIYDPRVGVPLCRRHHHRVTVAAQRMKRHQVPAEVHEFAAEHGFELALERELSWRGRGV